MVLLVCIGACGETCCSCGPKAEPRVCKGQPRHSSSISVAALFTSSLPTPAGFHDVLQRSPRQGTQVLLLRTGAAVCDLQASTGTAPAAGFSTNPGLLPTSSSSPSSSSAGAGSTNCQESRIRRFPPALPFASASSQATPARPGLEGRVDGRLDQLGRLIRRLKLG